LFKQTFSPKIGWERFLERLLPDVWQLPWAQELWQIRKMDGWLRGRAGSEITTSRVALSVMDAIFEELRVPHWAINGWKDVPDQFSRVVPESVRHSFMGREQDAIAPDWFVQDHGLSHYGKMVLRWTIEQLEEGMSPAFQVDDVLWIVHRIRLHRGTWLLDCWSDDCRVMAYDVERAPDKHTARSLPLRQLPGAIKFHSTNEMTPVWLDRADGLDCVDNPFCKHLGLTRGEVFLLDCAPTLPWHELRRKLPGTELLSNEHGVACDLPEGWTTRRVYPRYTRCDASDPAWVEFVTVLLPYASQIRLRTPEHPEIEGHPMLRFCSGTEERMLVLA
jgi:hypothetical protein